MLSSVSFSFAMLQQNETPKSQSKMIWHFKIFFSAWIIQNIEHETSISVEAPKLSLADKKIICYKNQFRHPLGLNEAWKVPYIWFVIFQGKKAWK